MKPVVAPVVAPVVEPLDPVEDLVQLIAAAASVGVVPEEEVVVVPHPEAEEARRALDDHLGMVRAKESQIEEVTKDLTSATLYGVNNEFLTLKEKCISTKFQGYNYEVCLFKSSKQDHVSLGSWDDNMWSKNQFGTAEVLRAKFINGQRCYNGPSRSMEVEFVCGVEDKILDVSEPSICEYKATFSTPAACTKASLVKLESGEL